MINITTFITKTYQLVDQRYKLINIDDKEYHDKSEIQPLEDGINDLEYRFDGHRYRSQIRYQLEPGLVDRCDYVAVLTGFTNLSQNIYYTKILARRLMKAGYVVSNYNRIMQASEPKLRIRDEPDEYYEIK